MALRLVGCSGDWRPSSIISRTPYSALEEKIISGLNPTKGLGLADTAGRRPCRVWKMDAGGLATSADIRQAADMARATGRLGIDTEFMSEGRYRALLCLVQVAIDNPDHEGAPLIYLVDALAEIDAQPFAELLADPSFEIVVHAGRQDVAI